jgi:PilZ domain
MKFTDSQFVELVELMQARESRKQHRKDKRRADRTEIRVPVKVRPDAADGADWQTVQLRDLSPRGVRLLMEQAMPQGSSFLISLPAVRGASAATPLLCRVAHCQEQGKGTFIIGAEFIGHIEPESKPDESAERERIRRTILD